MNEDGRDGGNGGDQPNNHELEKRVENLEDENEKLRRQITRFLPDGETRRQFLKLGGTAVAGAGVGSLLTAGATAQSQSGQIGTSSNPVGDIITQSITDASSGNSYDVDTLAGSGGGGANTEYSSDYGTDGSAIQDAINALSTGWGRVVIDSIDQSPYIVDGSAPIRIPSKTVLVIREDIQLADNVSENVFENENFEDDGTDDESIFVKFDGGGIDGNRQNNTYDASGRTHADGFYQNGICFLGVQGTAISNANIADSTVNALKFGGCENVRVLGGELHNSGGSAIQAHYRETDIKLNTNITFHGLTIRNAGVDIGGGAIRHSGTRNANVTQCTVIDSNNMAVNITNGDDGVDSVDCSISELTVDGAGTDETGYESAGVVVDTSPSGNSTGGEGVKNVRIVNSTISTDENHAIAIKSRENTISNVTVSACDLQSNGHVVLVDREYSGSPGISGVEIADGTKITHGSSPQTDANGVMVIGVSDGRVAAWFDGCERDGIAFQEDSTNSETPSSWNVSDCTHLNGGTYAVRIGDGNSIDVRNCRSEGHNRPVFEGSSASNCVFLFNDWRGDTDGPSYNGTGTITDPVNEDMTEDYNLT